MVGFDEIVFVGIIALLLFGPDKLPEYIREFGRLYVQFKKAQRDLEAEFNKGASAPGPSVQVRQPSQAVIGIAGKMNIPAEGKTEEQLLKEIDDAVSAKAEKV